MTSLISFRRLAITSVKTVLWEFWVCKNGFPQSVEASLLLFRHWVLSDSLKPCGLQHSRLPCSSPFPKFCSGSCPLSWLLWCSVTKSCPNSLPLRELQHTRFPCPFLSPWVCSNSYPLSQWCHPKILSSIVPFSFSPQSSPALGYFLMSRLFTSGGQSIGALASASVLSINIQGWFPLGLTTLIFLLSKSLLQHHNLKTSVLWCSASFMVQLSRPYMTTGKPISTFVGKVMSLLFNILSRLVIAFLPRSKSSEMEFLWLDDEGKGSFSRIYN